MSTIFSHAAVPVALGAWFPARAISGDILALGVFCSMLPDLDVVGFAFGVRYSDPLGHRGFTHSIAFAAVLGLLLAALLPHREGQRGLIFGFLFLCTLSHPFLDALTDGGLGVAWFWPFENGRYFFPWRPIAVPPIGIRAFFSPWGWAVLKSELLWIWMPSALVFGLGRLARMLL